MKKTLYVIISVILIFACNTAYADYYIQRLEMGTDVDEDLKGEYYQQTSPPTTSSTVQYNNYNNYNTGYYPLFPNTYYSSGYQIITPYVRPMPYGPSPSYANPPINPGSKPFPASKPFPDLKPFPGEKPPMYINRPGNINSSFPNRPDTHYPPSQVNKPLSTSPVSNTNLPFHPIITNPQYHNQFNN